MTAVQIRVATPADAEALHELMTELAHEDGGADQIRVTPDRWRALLGRDDVLVVLAEREDGRPLGYVSATRRLHLWFDQDIVAVDDVYVRPEARNDGVGRQLMTSFAGTVADGVHPIAAEAPLIRWELRADNDAAARFYRRMGAELRTKQIAVWTPEAYLPLVHHGSLTAHTGRVGGVRAGGGGAARRRAAP
jgi:GNAT superfamily N-acetyltransferase